MSSADEIIAADVRKAALQWELCMTSVRLHQAHLMAGDFDGAERERLKAVEYLEINLDLTRHAHETLLGKNNGQKT